MALVQLSISALPAHVRTARLVAAAVARRAGVTESALDEIRLAVGEACSRAVEAHRTHCPLQPVQVDLSDDSAGNPTSRGGHVPPPAAGEGAHSSSNPTSQERRFEVAVYDRAPAKNARSEATGEEEGLDGLILPTPPGGVSGLSPDIGLAVITGLAEHVVVDPTLNGTTIRMSWPLPSPKESDVKEPTGEVRL